MKIKFSICNILILGSMCMYLGMYSLVSQNPQQQLNLSASPPPAPTNVIAAITAGIQGNSQAYYWVVANYASGKSAFSTPSFIANAQTNANILVTWDSMAGATSYDILRTTTTVIPNTSCTCAVATAQVGTSYADTLNSALSGYTFSSVGPSSSVMFIDNIHYKSAVTKLTGSSVIGTPADTTLVMPDGSLNIRGNFYQNGVLFNGGGGGGITQLTGDGTAGPGSGSQALTLATVNAGPGDCGADATHVCDFVTDAQGRVRSQTLIALSGGGASEFGQLTNASLARTSNTILTLTLPSLGTNLGPTAKAFAASSQTITISTGCGVATTFFVYYSPNDQAIDIDTTAANFTGIAVTAGWATKSTGVTGFPNNGFGIVPVATLNCGVVANQWNAGAGAFTDNRTELSTSVINAGGTFLSESIDSKAQKTISVNTTHLTKAAGTLLVSASAALAGAAGATLCNDGSGGAKDTGCSSGGGSIYTATITPIVTANWANFGAAPTCGAGCVGSRDNTQLGPTGGGTLIAKQSTTTGDNLYGYSLTVGAGDFVRTLIIGGQVPSNSSGGGASPKVAVGFTDGTKAEYGVLFALNDSSNIPFSLGVAGFTATTLTGGRTIITTGGTNIYNIGTTYPLFFRLSRTGTALLCEYSNDGGISYDTVFNDTVPFLTASDIFVGTDSGFANTNGAFLKVTAVSCSTGVGGC